jgi:hypothetical protein
MSISSICALAPHKLEIINFSGCSFLFLQSIVYWGHSDRYVSIAVLGILYHFFWTEVMFFFALLVWPSLSTWMSSIMSKNLSRTAHGRSFPFCLQINEWFLTFPCNYAIRINKRNCANLLFFPWWSFSCIVQLNLNYMVISSSNSFILLIEKSIALYFS